MVIEAVATLATLSDKDAKNGSSLVAIRKQILATYGSNLNKQAASFNSLTLKGINKVGVGGSEYYLGRYSQRFYRGLIGSCRRRPREKYQAKRTLSTIRITARQAQFTGD